MMTLLRNDRSSHGRSVVEEATEEIGSGSIHEDGLRRGSGLHRAAGESARKGGSVLHERGDSERRADGKTRGIRNERCGVGEAVGVHESNLRTDCDGRYGGGLVA